MRSTNSLRRQRAVVTRTPALAFNKEINSLKSHHKPRKIAKGTLLTRTGNISQTRPNTRPHEHPRYKRLIEDLKARKQCMNCGRCRHRFENNSHCLRKMEEKRQNKQSTHNEEEPKPQNALSFGPEVSSVPNPNPIIDRMQPH